MEAEKSMARIAGIVLRTNGRKATARFYVALGLHENEHQHGGPIHNEFTPFSEEAVLEIYQASENFSRDALMIEVDSIDVSLQRISEKDTLLDEVKETQGMRFLYIEDPDDRPVMLLERKRTD